MFGKIVLRGVEVFGRLQQGFGGDAAYVQAGATQRGGVAFFVYACIDADGFETELGGADGGDIAAGACADYGDIVLLGHCAYPFISVFRRPLL